MKRLRDIFHRSSPPAAGARSGMTRRAVLFGGIAALAWCTGWSTTAAQAAEDARTLEERVKAAYLYRFAEYVEWPESTFARRDAPVTIGVLGSESLADELTQAVVGRTVNDRPLTVKRLKPGEPLAGIHVLFIGKAESARLNQLAQGAQPRSILTVTESDGALAQGSVINFVVADRRIRFEISLESAEKSKLKLSSRLLAVAQQVRTGTP
jgi:hypothetical protein